MLIDSFPIRKARAAADQAAGHIPAPINDTAAAREVIFELCLNVDHWANSEGRVFIENTGQHVMVTVVDRGVGIAATIRTIHPDVTEEEAVSLALTTGVSASRSDFRGYGLPSALTLTLRERFSAYLESGAVAVWMENGETEFSNKSGGAIQGTLARVIYALSE
ncbi:MAG: sensor histidine kinase [Acidimicrobiia bacterium]|nr:sensor histidine kinase [Acidimicrobiia bacterium]